MEKRRHHQTNGPTASKLSQIMKVDRRQGLLEFGAHHFVLKKQHFLGDGEEAASPDERSNAKKTEPDNERGQAAGVAGVWGSSLGAEKTTFSWW